MQLFATYRSRATRNIWAATELGLTLDMVPVWQAYRLRDAHAPDAPLNTLSPDFLAMSPAGAIPVLKDGDLILSESLGINLYLAQKAGGPLAAKDANEEAQMVQWALYSVTAMEPHTLPILYVHAEKRRDTNEGLAEIGTHVQALERPLKALNTHLTAHSHLIGDRFTVADINMAEVLRYAQAENGVIEGYAAVDAWLKSCQSRPAYLAMMAAREKEPVTLP
jgi:glutathione S-transferase